MWKNALKRTPLVPLVHALRRARIVRQWQRAGRPLPPPPAVKQRIVREYAKRFRLGTLVETGTYLGEMVQASHSVFSQIHSVELDTALFERAQEKFAGARGVHLWQGDSAAVLPQILAQINTPCLFWLDGHYSAGLTARGPRDTPVLEELQAIFAHPVAGHVVLIDDARCFTGEGDYPAEDALRARILRERPDWILENSDDVLRAHARPA